MPTARSRVAQIAAMQARLERVQSTLAKIEVELRALRRLEESQAGSQQAHSLAEAGARAERAYLKEAGDACGWNRTHLAARLGISRSTLYQKLRDHGLDRTTSSGPSQRGGPRRRGRKRHA